MFPKIKKQVVHALTDKTFKAKILYIQTVTGGARMFVELVYDKRNVEGLEGAREIILAELTKRVHQIFPNAEVKVKPMQANGLNSDASKSDREKLNRMRRRCLKSPTCGWWKTNPENPDKTPGYPVFF